MRQNSVNHHFDFNLHQVNMDHICAYFDTQGFYINNLFHPAEVALLADGRIIHLKVRKACDCSLSQDEKNQAKYLTTYLHGLEINNEGVSSQEMKEIIVKYFRASRKNGYVLAACKSKQAEELLDWMDIPFVNINNLYGASFKSIDDDRKPCINHKQNAMKYKCSHSIVQDMYTYMKKYKNGIDVID